MTTCFLKITITKACSHYKRKQDSKKHFKVNYKGRSFLTYISLLRVPLVACLLINTSFLDVYDTRAREQLLETRLSRVKKGDDQINDLIVV